MAIPQEILSVERPKNTIVKKSGERYLVIKRTCKRVNGKPKPVDLGTIGEIINGSYVEIRSEPRKQNNVVDIKDYGEFALCNKAAGNLFEKLAEVFDIQTAKRLYVLAVLRVAYPGIVNRDIKFSYETSFASEVFPGLSLSENSLTDFLQTVGMEYRYIRKFMENRAKEAARNNIVIDGTLVDNNSSTNDMSEFSRKATKKGSKDINLLYAMDLESKEPIAVKSYAGNMLDLTAVNDFITDNSITKELIILDKGFMSKNVLAKLKEKSNISYIIPAKVNSKLISSNNILGNIVTPLNGYKETSICYKKVKTVDGKYLYAYRDPKIAYEQEVVYTGRSQKNGKFKEENLKEKLNEFGVIVFVSKSDLDAKVVYEAYQSRWEIEVMFSMFKGIIEMSNVRVQGDYRLYATEFVNYLSVIISSRIKHLMATTVLREYTPKSGKTKKIYIKDDYSFKQLLRYLAKSKKARVGESKKWVDVQRLEYINDLCHTIGV